MRSGDPGPTARDTGAVGHRVSCPEFVGRGDELDVLGAALESAVAGRAGMVLVGGDAGIGKTRLVEELTQRARAAGALAATGVCVPVEGGGLPYAPVVGILRDLARQLGDVTATAVLGPLADGLGPRAIDDVSKTSLFESILTACTTLAERSPLLLVFDDLHWADSASAELLGFLVRNLDDARVLLAGTYRSDEVGPDHALRPWLAELGRLARVTQVHLDGLDRDELAAMLAGILGHDADWSLVDAVWSRSQGNPFFAEELTAAGPAPSLPPELQRVVMNRVEGLSKKAQQVLRIAALAGPQVEHRLLAAAADGLDADDLDDAVAEAVDNRLLVVDESRTGYRLRHALLREAVDASVLPGERARLHRRLAEAVTVDASFAPGEPAYRAAALAVHWWGAGAWNEAFAASVDAADAARTLWAFPEALVHYERALACLERTPVDAQPAPAVSLGLLDAAAEAAYLSGAGERSVALLEQAIDRAGAEADPADVARRYAMLGRSKWGVGDSDAAFAAYRAALELMPTDPPTPELAQVLAEEARGLMLMSRFGESEAGSRQAIDVARAVGARAQEGNALNTMGVCLGVVGRVDEGVALLRQALAIAEDLGIPDDIDRAYTNLSAVLLDCGRLEEAAGLVFDSLAAGDQFGFLKLNGAAANSAHALIRLGRWDEADALLAQLGDQGIGVCASAPQLVPVGMRVRQGRFDEAVALLVEADTLTARLTDVQTRGLFHIESALLALEQGRPADAYGEVERALALAAGTDDESFVPEMCALGVRALADRVDEARGRGERFDPDKARLLAQGLVEELARLVAARAAMGSEATARTLAYAALCAAEQSRLHGSDAALWLAAGGAWSTAGEPYDVAYCRWREAEALLEGRSERGRAGECLQQAWQTATSLGAVPLRERIEQLAQRARVVLRADVGGGADTNGSTLGADLGLTPREVEVLGLLAAGRTDREIADTLFISKKTASVHVSNLLRKLDITSRVEAGRIGQAHGLGS